MLGYEAMAAARMQIGEKFEVKKKGKQKTGISENIYNKTYLVAQRWLKCFWLLNRTHNSQLVTYIKLNELHFLLFLVFNNFFFLDFWTSGSGDKRPILDLWRKPTFAKIHCTMTVRLFWSTIKIECHSWALWIVAKQNKKKRTKSK